MKKKVIKIMKISTSLLLAVILIGMLFTQSCSSATYSTEDIKMEKVEKSKQYKEGKFVGYKSGPEWKLGKVLPIMWDFLFTGNDRKPEVDLPTQSVDFGQITNVKPNELKVTWVGHSSQIINIDGRIILTDPVYENKTVFMGPSRYNGDIPINIDELPEIDLVVISHNHYDHLNSSTIEKIYPKVKKFIAPLMVGAELEEMGVPREKIIELDWWEEVKLFDNFLIVLTPTQHFSGRGLFDRDETLWGSYVISGPKHKIYFSGDSGYFEGFKEIGDKYGPFDYTFLECGAYNEKWHFVHMFPEETVQAHIDLKGKILHPIHWGTFDLALHAWYDPMIRVAKAADSLGIKLSTPIVGKTITVDQNLETDRWWETVLNNRELAVAK
jgi:L-ascorbate metabolism protein UlaG (beta-lactamase superfamily)